jgi:Fe-S-cluster containining protein
MNADEPPDGPQPGRFRAALRELYSELDQAITQLAPVCQLSGRCCRFKEYDHTLFVSAGEAELLLAEASPPVRTLDRGETCPWQDEAGRCTARNARPLGCRVYFCDPAYQTHASTLSEQFIARLKRLVDEHGLPWHYAPLHHHLESAREDARFFPPSLPTFSLEPGESATGSRFLA